MNSVLLLAYIVFPGNTTIAPQISAKSGWVHAPAVLDVRIDADAVTTERYWSNGVVDLEFTAPVTVTSVLLGDPAATCRTIVGRHQFPSRAAHIVVAVQPHPGNDVEHPKMAWNDECLVVFGAIESPTVERTGPEILSEAILWRESILIRPSELIFLFEDFDE